MTAILSKPAGEIDFSDVESLIELQVPESDQTEFKETLPAKGKTVDPWMKGQDKIGDKAKKEILEEVTAFANAYGGVLVLGIKESDTKPAVAAEISPLPRYAELADRCKLVFRDCVEPQIPQLEIFAVPEKAGSDKGVVVFRVGKSRVAPHRVTSTLICPIRRLNRCEKMSMREIQDMTLNVNRGLELLDKRLKERSERFQEECETLDLDKACGVRLTAMPVGGDIRDVRLFNGERNENLYIPWCKVSWKPRSDLGELTFPLIFQPQHSDWRPRLRFARTDISNEAGKSYAEIHWDGLLELGCVFDPSWFFHGRASWFQLDWLFPLFATFITWVDRVREKVGVPAAEYAFEMEIYANDTVPLSLGGDSIHHVIRPFREKLKQGFITFPRYPMGSSDEGRKLLASFMRDCLNLGGDPGAVKEDDLKIKQTNEE